MKLINYVTDYDSTLEGNESKPQSLKKALVVSVMAISIGMVMFGVGNTNKTDVSMAIAIEDSHWSDFDSSMVDSYFNIISSGSQYKMLEPMCLENSQVYDAIVDNEGNMQHLYDEYYGRAQGIQVLGSHISVKEIHGVSDGEVSLTINYISEADLYQFFAENSNDLYRYFTTHDLTKENLIREMFTLLETYNITTTEKTIELPVEMKDGVYCIANDSKVLELLNGSYESALNQMINQLGVRR